MNKKEIISTLAKNLEEYLHQGFRFHSMFMEEFKGLLHDAQGHEKEVFSLLVKQLNFVKVLGSQVYNANGNEIIKYLDKEYYSLHLSGKNFNLRLLMTFDKKDNPIFLAAFYERAEKKVSDYTQWKSVLKKRYDQMEEKEVLI